MSLVTVGLVLYHPHMNKVGSAGQGASLQCTQIRTRIHHVHPGNGAIT